MAEALFVRKQPLAPQPAPFAAAGLSGWVARRFFASPAQFAMTVIGAAAFSFILYPALRFFLLDAVWTGQNREACANVTTGACWPFVQAKFNQFIYGFYPAEERWRPNIVFALGAVLLHPAADAVGAAQAAQCVPVSRDLSGGWICSADRRQSGFAALYRYPAIPGCSIFRIR